MGDKVNLFYIGIVWIPIFVASINTILVKKKYDKELSLPKILAVAYVLAIIVAIPMAKMTDPNLSFSFPGALDSLFQDRKYNHFEIYDGYYPPMMLSIMMTLYHLIPMVIMGLIEAAMNWYRYSKTKRAALKAMIRIDEEDKEIEALPWETDYENLKADLKKKKKEKK